MTDPDCHDCTPHDPGQDLRTATIAGLGALALILAVTAAVAVVIGVRAT